MKLAKMEDSKIEKLERELTCAICEEQYSDPRLLSCMHYYCKACIQQLIDSEATETRCPECRLEIDAGKAESLKPAFFVHRLQDVYNSLALEQGLSVAQSATLKCDMCSTTSGTVEVATSICLTCKRYVCQSCELVHKRVKDYEGHQITRMPVSCDEASPQQHMLPHTKDVRLCTKHEEPCKIYCTGCEELICTVCKVLIHSDHTCEGIVECAPRCKETLRVRLGSVRERKDKVSAALQKLEEREDEVSAEASLSCNQIMMEFVKLSDMVDRARDEALQRVKTLEADKMAHLKAKTKTLEIFVSDLSRILETGGQLLTVASPQGYLAQHRNVLQQIESTVCQSHDLKPTVDANMAVLMDETVHQKIADVCHVYTMQPDPSQCTVSGLGLEHAIMERRNDFALQLAYSNGKPCSEQQYCVDISIKPTVEQDQQVATDIEVAPPRDQPGRYLVSYTPHSRGSFKIEVSVNGTMVSGSPFDAFVTAHPTDLGAPVRVIDVRTQIDGLAITADDQLVVSEKNKSEVSIWSKNGKKIRVIKVSDLLRVRPFLCCPTGVAVDTAGCMYIADNKSHCLLKLSPLGAQLIKSIECEGSNPGQLKSPGGVRISRKGEVYVCDCGNHRVQVFDQDLHFLRSFGRKGQGDGEFIWPVDLVFDRNNYIYISDMDNHRIQVFDHEEKFVRLFGEKGSYPGQLHRPVFMFMDSNDFLYVSENENHRVSVFKASGEFVTILGGEGVDKGQTKSPKGIVMDKLGYLYVGERGNKRIQVF